MITMRRILRFAQQSRLLDGRHSYHHPITTAAATTTTTTATAAAATTAAVPGN